MTNNGKIDKNKKKVRKIEILNQRYKIINMISANQENRVYVCIDQKLGVSRIIKESKKKNNKENGDFTILKHLHHIGLPNIFDVFEDAKSTYVVIEHIDGDNLKRFIEKHGQFDVQKGLIVIKQLLFVLQYLHTLRPKAVIHGDIKPENIIVNDDRTVLIDFASVNNQKGTSSFLAPERIIGMKKNEQSDIYSLGLVINYMFTGKIKKIFTDELPIDFNKTLKYIIEKCTKKNIKERYKSVGEILSDIEKIKFNHYDSASSSRIKVISVHNNSYLAAELAFVIAKTNKKKTLLIDSNIFESEIDYLIPKNKCKLYLQDFTSEYINQLYYSNRNKNLSILPCRSDIESYENFSPKILENIVSEFSKGFDVIIINCTDFIYDALCIKSIYLSDIVLYSIKRGVSDIRKYNSIIYFLNNRQNISKDRFMFLQFNINSENIRESLVSKAVEAKYLGQIPYSKKRIALNSTAMNYTYKMEKKIRREYIKLIKKLNI